MLIEKIIEVSPQRCISEKLGISAFMLLDEHYGFKLSKLSPEQVVCCACPCHDHMGWIGSGVGWNEIVSCLSVELVHYAMG